MQIKSALGAFFSEFSKLETDSVATALRALASDPGFLAQTQELLGFEARLTLLERLAFSRGISEALLTELTELLMRTRKLRGQRDELSRALDVSEADGTARSATFLLQIKALAAETIRLQQGFNAFASRISR